MNGNCLNTGNTIIHVYCQGLNVYKIRRTMIANDYYDFFKNIES